MHALARAAVLILSTLLVAPALGAQEPSSVRTPDGTISGPLLPQTFAAFDAVHRAAPDQVPTEAGPLYWAIAPIVARNMELEAMRLAIAWEMVINPQALGQVLMLSVIGGRTGTELRNYWTLNAMAGLILGSGPLYRTVHPRIQAGLVVDRSSFTQGSADPRTAAGLALRTGLLYGLTSSLLGAADVSLERVAGLNQFVVSLSLLAGPLGSWAR
ncbi:MAG: hypothetical protein R3E98_08945 [Gemmatimonadota bacterium]